MCDSTHRTPLTAVKFREKDGRMLTARGLGGGGDEWLLLFIGETAAVF